MTQFMRAGTGAQQPRIERDLAIVVEVRRARTVAERNRGRVQRAGGRCRFASGGADVERAAAARKSSQIDDAGAVVRRNATAIGNG
jgi:hypothetical protein